MECSYDGKFDQAHKVKKRRLIGPVITKALKTIIEEKESSVSYREREAVRLMKLGKYLFYWFPHKYR